MTVYEFGKALLDENDLDPLYVMAHGAKITKEEGEKYTLGYLLSYNTGVASLLTSSVDFWKEASKYSASSSLPRGTDRRHFRLPESARIITQLSDRYDTPSDWIKYCRGKGLSSLKGTMLKVRSHRGFGPTIAFKASDMLEQLHGLKLIFQTNDPKLMSKAPKQGAEMVAESEGYEDRKTLYLHVHNRILERIGDVLVPPLFSRKMAVMETETILCKYSHYRKGRYYVGKGKESQRKGLEPHRGNEIVEKMIESGVQQGLWK